MCTRFVLVQLCAILEALPEKVFFYTHPVQFRWCSNFAALQSAQLHFQSKRISPDLVDWTTHHVATLNVQFRKLSFASQRFNIHLLYLEILPGAAIETICQQFCKTCERSWHALISLSMHPLLPFLEKKANNYWTCVTFGKTRTFCFILLCVRISVARRQSPGVSGWAILAQLTQSQRSSWIWKPPACTAAKQTLETTKLSIWWTYVSYNHRSRACVSLPICQRHKTLQQNNVDDIALVSVEVQHTLVQLKPLYCNCTSACLQLFCQCSIYKSHRAVSKSKAHSF